LGRYIVEALLARGDTVVTISRSTYAELQRPGVTQVVCDLRHRASVEEAFRGADQVFHVGARVGVWGPWREYFEVNVLGTENVLRACRIHGVRRLIYTSTPSVVFDGSDHRGVDESTPYSRRWLSPYPHSKMLAEEKVLAANGKDGLLTVALRPHLIWGKGDRYLIPRVISQARGGKLLRVGDGKNQVDIVHVRNAAEAHLRAADSLASDRRSAGKAYFLSQGRPVVLWDFIDEILRREGLPALTKSISFATAYRLGASLEWGYRFLAPHREPRMTRFLAHTLAKDHYYDIRAAERDFGYQPLVSTAAGLDELFPT
jgi:nucleoside-diphosphate-sugar epimerase